MPYSTAGWYVFTSSVFASSADPWKAFLFIYIPEKVDVGIVSTSTTRLGGGVRFTTRGVVLVLLLLLLSISFTCTCAKYVQVFEMVLLVYTPDSNAH